MAIIHLDAGTPQLVRKDPPSPPSYWSSQIFGPTTGTFFTDSKVGNLGNRPIAKIIGGVINAPSVGFIQMVYADDKQDQPKEHGDPAAKKEAHDARKNYFQTIRVSVVSSQIVAIEFLGSAGQVITIGTPAGSPIIVQAPPNYALSYIEGYCSTAKETPLTTIQFFFCNPFPSPAK